jgi:hypothetical protein
MVTQNLLAAMRQCRHIDKPRTLRIDTICIGQFNFTEKEQQFS